MRLYLSTFALLPLLACGPTTAGIGEEDGGTSGGTSDSGTSGSGTSGTTIPVPTECNHSELPDAVDPGYEFTTADGCQTLRCEGPQWSEVESQLEVVEGDLSVSTAAEVADLVCVVEITGSFTITGTDGGDIGGLEPLGRLSQVGVDFIVLENPDLTSLEGLTPLRNIGRELRIESNPALPSLTGLSPILSVLGPIRVIDNDLLVDLQGMGFLSCVGCGPLPDEFDTGEEPQISAVYGDLEIAQNDALGDMTQIAGVAEIWGSLLVEGNAILPTTAGLGSLYTVMEDFNIVDNPMLPTTEAQNLAAASGVAGIVTICGNMDGEVCP